MMCVATLDHPRLRPLGARPRDTAGFSSPPDTDRNTDRRRPQDSENRKERGGLFNSIRSGWYPNKRNGTVRAGEKTMFQAQ